MIDQKEHREKEHARRVDLAMQWLNYTINPPVKASIPAVSPKFHVSLTWPAIPDASRK